MEKRKVITSFLWRFFERCGAEGVSFIVSIVLARLLEPTVYGTVALVYVFTGILGVFVKSGFGSALIQKKDADDLDFSSVFYFNIFLSVVLYIGIFICAPFIALFYHDASLTALVRVLSISLIISGVNNVQQAYVSKNMLFRRFFFSTLGGTIGAAVIGIVMAYRGYGVWALVAQSLFNQTVDTIILWITVKWRPKKQFSFKRLKTLFGFGWKLLASSLLDTIYGKLRQLIIGKMYTASDLAYYNKGNTFPALITENINSSLDSVLFPTMSARQDERNRIKEITQKAMKTSSYIILPFMMGLAVCAEPIVRLLLTEKWLPCVLYLRIFCFTYALWPMHTANLNAIKAMGRSDLFLKLEIIKKAVGMVLLLSTMWFGVEIMAYSLLLSSILSTIINARPNKALLGYGYVEQLTDIVPNILVAFAMGICVFPVVFLDLPDIAILMIQIPLGAVIYILFSKLFKLDSFNYLISLLKSTKKRG